MSDTSMTKVTMKYTKGMNISVTVRDGVVSKVTTWQTGVSKSTERIVDEKPEKGIKRFNKKATSK